MIQKIKLDFSHSVNLGSIIVNIITKNKINRCSSGDRTSDLLLAKPSVQQASNILVGHYLIFFFVLFCQLSELIGPHRFFSNTF